MPASGARPKSLEEATRGISDITGFISWDGDTEAQIRRIGARAAFAEAVSRKRGANLLIVGAMCGFFGFLFAFLIGLINERLSGRHDLNGNPFRSGRGYFPSTVSEMVHNPNQPAGKVFFGFCFVGATMIFLSWYPTQLRNVYIGDDAQVCGISWVTIRQFVPAPGMMMLSIITTVPAPQATLTDQFCIGLHLLGAAMLFVGYFACEAHAIGWGPFKGLLDVSKMQDSKRSLRKRKLCLTGIGFFYLVFCVIQVVLSLPAVVRVPYNDQWGHLEGHNGVQLLNTASWRIKWLKVASYTSEVVCGLLLIASHMVIWYHSEERHYDLPEQLAGLHGKVDFGKSEAESSGESPSDEQYDDSDSEPS